jgi:alpha-beta hydrolase superfamily lysophospholipase
MLTRARAWARTHRKSVAALLAATAFLAVNALAFLHARAMTHFGAGGEPTGRPESLSRGEKLRALILGVNVPRPRNVATPASVGLEFETRTFPSEGGVELEAWHVPCERSRGLVLLFHGYASSKSSLLAVARALHDMGYATFLVDFRGSGGSSGDTTTLGVLEGADVASAAGSARSTGHGEPLFLYGISMGSVAILRAIHVHHVRPDAIVLECPFGRLLDTVEARFALMGVPSFPLARLLVFWGGFQHGFDGFAHEPVGYARSVACPALLLQGEDDPTISVAQSREIFERLGGPKTHRTFPGVGHESILARRPAEWRAAVSSLLASPR